MLFDCKFHFSLVHESKHSSGGGDVYVLKHPDSKAVMLNLEQVKGHMTTE